jgi:hypothetical protein
LSPIHASNRPYSKSTKVTGIGHRTCREERETTALTGKIHNIVIKFDFGPVFEHGPERGTGTFRSFHLWDRYDFVWVHDGMGTLRKGDRKSEGIGRNE